MSKISELSDGGSLVSSDYLIAVRSGGNVKVRMDQINVDQVDLGDNEFIRLGNSQDLTMVHTATQSIINQAGIGDLLIQKAGATKLTINATGIDVTGTVTADGATFSGAVDITANVDDQLTLSRAAGNNRILKYETAGVARWAVYADGVAEAGSDAGSDYQISYYNDAGVYQGNALTLTRATGAATFSGTVTADGGSISGNLLVGTSVSSAKLTVGTFGDTARAAQFHGSDILLDGGAASEIIMGDGNVAYMSIQTTDDATAMKIRNYSGSADLVTIERASGKVGIGTSSPTAPLTILSTGWEHLNLVSSDADATNKTGYLTVGHYTNAQESFGIISGQSTTSSNVLNIGGGAAGLNAATSINLYTASNNTTVTGTPRVSIDASGLVGIGNPSPTDKLHLGTSSGATQLKIQSGSGINNCILHTNGTTDSWRTGMNLSLTDGSYEFYDDVNNVSRMTIDASGNLLVGTTSTAVSSSTGSVTGTVVNNSGLFEAAKTGTVMELNRLSADGTILNFRKDGTTVGSISAGALSGGVNPLAIGYSTCGIWFIPAASAIAPFDMSTNSAADNSIDWGYASIRWDDIYATNGTIQTSDRNEKQDIEALSDAEQRVAVAAKGLLRKFRWKSSVAENGDEARTHFGIIAQDLQAAFVAEGLDAGDYAMFINSTWTDEETGEERSRMGVRYSELLAFIIAAI